MVVVHLLLSCPSLTVSLLQLSGTEIPLDKILFLIFYQFCQKNHLTASFIHVLWRDIQKRVYEHIRHLYEEGGVVDWTQIGIHCSCCPQSERGRRRST